VSCISNADTTVARKISVLKRGIDKSLMELTEVEVAINARPNSSLIEGGGLKRKRLLLSRRSRNQEGSSIGEASGSCRGHHEHAAGRALR
jgi:hypothetical protein